MNLYKTPQSRLHNIHPKNLFYGRLNRSILLIEFIFLLIPVTLAFIFASVIIMPSLPISPLSLMFFLPWLLTLVAIVSLAVSMLAIIFRLQALHPMWHRLPYLGVLIVILAFFAQHLPADKLFSSVELNNALYAFVIGAVLFIPLAHSQMSLRLGD